MLLRSLSKPEAEGKLFGQLLKENSIKLLPFFFCVFVQQFFSVDNKAATSTEKSEFDTKTVGSMFADFYRNLRYQLGMSKKKLQIEIDNGGILEMDI